MHCQFTIRWILVIALVSTVSAGHAQETLASNAWFKLGVEKRGVYKISYDDFKKMGFDPATVDPRQIAIYGNPGGMLPQENDAPRFSALQENAIYIEGEGDGVFDKNDYILFYAEGPDAVHYDAQHQVFAYQSNLYSKKNFYFITVATGSRPARIQTVESVAGNFPLVEQYDDFVYHELEDYNELESGRQWFGERFDLTTSYSFKSDIAGVVENSNVKIVSDVMAQCYDGNGSTFKISLNNTPAGEQNVSAITNSTYAVKGAIRLDTLTLNASTAGAIGQTTQTLTYQYVKGGGTRSVGFLDFFLLNFTRKLAVYGDQTFFVSPTSLDQPVSQYRVAAATADHRVWDITDPLNVQQQAFTIQDGGAQFSAASDVLHDYIVFNTNAPAPALVGKVANQNVGTPSPVNYIVITHPDFMSEAQRLAAHRGQHNQWSTLVVTPEQIFNEFSSGRQDVTAIRDFIRRKYEAGPTQLKAVVFVGKGSYDYKDRLSNNTNFVPTYEARNSLSPLETYSSDDFYALLEPGEGGWGEDPAHAETLDIGVGRIPAKTLEEASHVVTKIIDYDTNKKSLGRWRKDIVFVADDGSLSDGFTSIHQSQADVMSTTIETGNPQFDTHKIFLGTYTKTVKPNGEAIPEVNEAILRDFNRGTLIINYTGHGSEKLWADEKVFTDIDILTLENKLYPFLITATCEFGRQDDPQDISSAELSVLRSNGGTVGLVTTSRPVKSDTNFELNKSFYANLLQKESGQIPTLGEVFRKTKNQSTSGVFNRNFSLLADPGMTLAMTPNIVAAAKPEVASGADTLKALSVVTISGEVQDGNGVLIPAFNGTLHATLYDKQSESVTIGKNNPPFHFKEWSNVLFRGKATVKDGLFSMKFVVPKNIAYEVGAGKLSFYASDSSHMEDAAGALSTPVGGSEKSVAPDNTPPEIRLFMGDTTFVNGGMVLPNTSLLVRLHDASGINTSTYGIGNTLTGVLDDDVQVYALSDYYEADTDDFTRGWVNFPINGLAPGKHTITVKVWDTYNNPAQSVISFMVTDGKSLIIESLSNAPNPFQGESHIFFTHNRSGDDLEAQLYIYNITGQQMMAYNFSIPSSPYQVDLMEINAGGEDGKKLVAGVYLARLAVRSVTNGSKSERVTKLIVVN